MKNRLFTTVFLALAMSACVDDGARDADDPAEDGNATSEVTASSTYFTYPGITCGPDSKAYISMTISGSGYVDGDYATSKPTGTGTAFGAYTFKGAGNHTKTMASRYLNSYDIVKHGSVTVVAHGAGCT